MEGPLKQIRLVAALDRFGSVEEDVAENQNELHDHLSDFCGQREVPHWLLSHVV